MSKVLPNARFFKVGLGNMRKKIYNNNFVCLPDGHVQFECSVLHSNVDFYFKFDIVYILTALVDATLLNPIKLKATFGWKAVGLTVHCFCCYEGRIKLISE